MKTYIAIVRDHSASMSPLIKSAMADYNLIIDGIRESKSPDDETFITVVECGVGHLASIQVVESKLPVERVNKISMYSASGSGTPLFDSVGTAIQNLKTNRVYEDDNTAYLVMVITDGEENRSRNYNSRTLAEKIRQLQATDKWTFVFRGPRGSSRQFQSIGVEPGNIMEWEQTHESLAHSTVATTQGLSGYFSTRATGGTSTRSFYSANINVPKEDVVRAVKDMTSEFNVWSVIIDSRIDDFVRALNSGVYHLGRGFYQLTKPEKAVQEYKEIALLDKSTGKIYSGTTNVRSILGLPLKGTIKLVPGDHRNYDIFIQSTSNNRKLVAGTRVLYKR